MATLRFQIELEEDQPLLSLVGDIVHGINVIYYLSLFGTKYAADALEYFITPPGGRQAFLRTRVKEDDLLTLTDFGFTTGFSSKVDGKVSSKDKDTLDLVADILRRLNGVREETRGKSVDEKRQAIQEVIKNLPEAPSEAPDSVRMIVSLVRTEYSVIFASDSVKSLVLETQE